MEKGRGFWYNDAVRTGRYSQQTRGGKKI